MTKDLANVRIYGDADSAVWVADHGTTMPTTLAVPESPFAEAGWISEDGVPLAREADSASFPAWQGGKIVRRKFTSREDTFTFTALEENAVVLGLFEPGAEITTTTGVTKIVPAQGLSADPRCFVLDFHDGTVHKRYNVISGEVTGFGEVPHQNSEMTAFEFTVTMYEYEILTNNPAVAVAP